MARPTCSNAYIARYVFLLVICLASMFGIAALGMQPPPVAPF